MIDLGLSLDRSWLTEGPPTIAGAARARAVAQHRHARPRAHPHGRRRRRRLRAQPHAGHDRPRRGPARDAGADHATIPTTSTASIGWRPAWRNWTTPYLLDSILAPINSGLRRVAGALRRGPPAPSRSRAADGDRQPDGADRGRHDRRDRAADRLLPGGRHRRGADDRGDRVGAAGRCARRSWPRRSCTSPSVRHGRPSTSIPAS